MRQSPHGVFCDGINKILLPSRPRTAVVVTGNITLQDTANVPKEELCDFLAKNRAPIDFGRSAREFLDSTGAPFLELNWSALTDQIHQSIAPYIKTGNLNPFFGTEIAQIIFAEFEPSTQSSKLLSLAVNLDSAGNLNLQPVRLTAATTIRGDSFDLQSDRKILPFGEVAYYQQQVVAGVGKQFLSHSCLDLVACSWKDWRCGSSTSASAAAFELDHHRFGNNFDDGHAIGKSVEANTCCSAQTRRS